MVNLMRQKTPRTSPESFERARQMARTMKVPIYVFGDQVTSVKPPRTTAMVWPNGSVTWGNAQASDRDRRMPAA